MLSSSAMPIVPYALGSPLNLLTCPAKALPKAAARRLASASEGRAHGSALYVTWSRAFLRGLEFHRSECQPMPMVPFALGSPLNLLTCPDKALPKAATRRLASAQKSYHFMLVKK